MTRRKPMAIRNRPASPKRSWWRMAAMGIMGLLCLVIMHQLWLFCWVVYYNFPPPSQTSVMRQELSRLQESNPKATLRYEWVDYENIDDSLKRAVVAAEDANFVDHSGVEWEAIRVHRYPYFEQIRQIFENDPPRVVFRFLS